MGQFLSYIAQTEQEAWVAFLYACSFADKPGTTNKEVYRITQLRFRSSVLPIPHDDNLFKHLSAVGERIGSKGLVDGAKGRIHHTDMPTLFTYCCEVTYAEGHPNNQKQEILMYIGKALGITPEFFKCCIVYQKAHCAKDESYFAARC